MKLSVDVHNFLQNNDVQHEFFIMETPSKNAEHAAAILGLRPKEVVSSTIILVNNKPVNAIIPLSRQINTSKIESLFPKSIVEIANDKDIVETTGYVIGATPPVALKNECQTIIDESCMGLDVLYTGGGEPSAMLKIRPQDLKNLTNAQVADISVKRET